MWRNTFSVTPVTHSSHVEEHILCNTSHTLLSCEGTHTLCNTSHTLLSCGGTHTLCWVQSYTPLLVLLFRQLWKLWEHFHLVGGRHKNKAKHFDQSEAGTRTS